MLPLSEALLSSSSSSSSSLMLLRRVCLSSSVSSSSSSTIASLLKPSTTSSTRSFFASTSSSAAASLLNNLRETSAQQQRSQPQQQQQQQQPAPTSTSTSTPAQDIFSGISSLEDQNQPGGRDSAVGYGNKTLSPKQRVLYQRAQQPAEIGWRDKQVLNLLKSIYPVLGNHVVSNAADPDRLCIHIRSPLSTFIRSNSIHQTAKSLVILTYENPITKKLQLGLRWWFYEWSEDLSNVGDYLPPTETESTDVAAESTAASPALSPFASPTLLAAIQCANIARSIIEGKSKVQTFVWKDTKTQEHMVRPSLVNSKAPSVPPTVADYAVVYTLSWTGKDSWNTATNSPLFRQIHSR